MQTTNKKLICSQWRKAVKTSEQAIAKSLARIERYKDDISSKPANGKHAEASHAFTISMPQVSLDKDVVLSEKTRVQLEEGLAKLKYHKKIYQEWNFGSVDRQGRSVILNFFGKPGTGKTLTAEAFAGSLSMPIIKMGIAELESKFMGETSKNIQAVFELATKENAVLFFDEADTLLGKRLSSVTQGIDNEVNAMRSTLLIELEKFDGVAIFATNFAKNYDEAFRSRISHHIEFDLPDLVARTDIWNKMLVAEIPLACERDQLIEQAAQHSEGLSGREIRTCMRLVLPKVLLEAEQTQSEARLKVEQLLEVIERVKSAHKKVANSDVKIDKGEIQAVRTLMGVKNKEEKEKGE